MSTVAELVTRLGFKVDNKGLSGYQKSLDNIVNRAKQIAFVYLSFTGIKSFFTMIRQTADAADALDDLSRSIGLTANQLEKLSFIAGTVGISQEGVIQTIGIFNKKLGDAKLGAKEAVETFSKLGINPKKFKDSTSAFLAATKAIGKIKDENIQASYAMDLFGRSGKTWLSLIRESPEKIESLTRTFEALNGTVNQNFLANSETFSNNIGLLNAGWIGLKRTIVGALLPALNEMFDSLFKWYIANKQIINQNLEAFFLGVSSALKFVGEIIGNFIKHTTALKIVLLSLGAILTYLFFPLIAAITLFTTIVLIVNDLINYLDGNDSVIGKFFNSKAGKVFLGIIKGIIQGFKWIIGLVGKLFSGLWDIVLVVADVAKGFGEKLWAAFKWVGKGLDWLANAFANIWGVIKSSAISFVSELKDILDPRNWLESGFDSSAIKDAIQKIKAQTKSGDFQNIVSLARSNIATASSGPVVKSNPINTTVMPVSNNNDVKYQPTINVNVSTDADPKEIADMVNKSQKSVFDAMLRDAFRSTQGGLR